MHIYTHTYTYICIYIYTRVYVQMDFSPRLVWKMSGVEVAKCRRVLRGVALRHQVCPENFPGPPWSRCSECLAEMVEALDQPPLTNPGSRPCLMRSTVAACQPSFASRSYVIALQAPWQHPFSSPNALRLVSCQSIAQPIEMHLKEKAHSHTLRIAPSSAFCAYRCIGHMYILYVRERVHGNTWKYMHACIHTHTPTHPHTHTHIRSQNVYICHQRPNSWKHGNTRDPDYTEDTPARAYCETADRKMRPRLPAIFFRLSEECWILFKRPRTTTTPCNFSARTAGLNSTRIFGARIDLRLYHFQSIASSSTLCAALSLLERIGHKITLCGDLQFVDSCVSHLHPHLHLCFLPKYTSIVPH